MLPTLPVRQQSMHKHQMRKFFLYYPLTFTIVLSKTEKFGDQVGINFTFTGTSSIMARMLNHSKFVFSLVQYLNELTDLVTHFI